MAPSTRKTLTAKPNASDDEMPPPMKTRADMIPTDGYILSVDGKLKARYETAKEATAAASSLKQKYPVIQVKIYDAAKQSLAAVELPEKEARE